MTQRDRSKEYRRKSEERRRQSATAFNPDAARRCTCERPAVVAEHEDDAHCMKCGKPV